MDGILEKNLERVRNEIALAQQKSGREKTDVKIVAVSKLHSREKVIELYELGIRDFAENYWQEAREKMESLKDYDISWHFIGNIQKKKVNHLVGAFDLIHSLDRYDIAERASQKAIEMGIVQNVLVQVNIAKEHSKQGLHPNEVIVFLHQLTKLKGLQVCGLMIFPPLRKNEEQSHHWFHEGNELFEVARGHMGKSFQHLSMGTTNDYWWAVEEGANMLRIGEGLFGPRM